MAGNPTVMRPEEIVAEILEIRDDLTRKSSRLAELSQALHDQARRRGARREYERLSTLVNELDGFLRTASGEQAEEAQTELARAQYEQRAQRERIAAYTVFSSTWTRFAGMLAQALQRARSAERLVGQLPARTEEEPRARRRPEPVEAAAPPVAHAEPVPQRTMLEELIEMYGSELVGDADRR
jgi:hypothetical protein